jgi:trk system potassium uptake protein TrkA
MKQFALIGIGTFAKRLIEELSLVDCEILMIDKDSAVVDFYKDVVTSAYIADVINEETITKLVPGDIDAAIVDMGSNTEVSILVTNYLKKRGVRNIIVKAETDQHGEILEIVGADHVIFPNREAAHRITPLLVSDLLFNYMPISNGLVMAEVKIPQEFIGQTLIEANIRQNRGINVVAIRKAHGGDFEFFSPDYIMKSEDIFLIVGSEENVMRFAGAAQIVRKKTISDLFRKIFRGGR